MIANKQDTRPDSREDRCRDCRYWFERCCHALALMDGADSTPSVCGHYALAPQPASQGARPC